MRKEQFFSLIKSETCRGSSRLPLLKSYPLIKLEYIVANECIMCNNNKSSHLCVFFFLGVVSVEFSNEKDMEAAMGRNKSKMGKRHDLVLALEDK